MESLRLAWLFATLTLLAVWGGYFAYAQHEAVRFLNLTARGENAPLSRAQQAVAEDLATAQALGFLAGVFGPGIPALWMALGIPVTATNLPILAGAVVTGLAVSLATLIRLRRTSRCLARHCFSQGALTKPAERAR